MDSPGRTTEGVEMNEWMEKTPVSLLLCSVRSSLSVVLVRSTISRVVEVLKTTISPPEVGTVRPFDRSFV